MEIQKKTIDDVLNEELRNWNGGVPPKSKKCTSCKKKPPVEELPPPQVIELVTKEEVIFLYTEMTRKSFTDEMFNELNMIYTLLFNEPFNRCQGCDRRQYRKVKHYIDTHYPKK
jgi:hypothetical protein